MTRKWAMTLTALALITALNACGRKGDLEPPPGMSAEQISAQEKAKAKTDGCLTADGNKVPSAPIDAQVGGAQSGNTNLLEGYSDKPNC